jgi:chromate transporter
MFRSGALVFGGGHVVLPLLRAETVPDLVPADTFLAGYGAAQAVPGPLFTFGAFLGEVAAGPLGAVVATLAIFTPGLLLFFGALPFWQAVRSRPAVRAGLVGVNAGVVGLLGAAWIDPIVTTSVTSPLDAGYAAALFALLRWHRLPPIAVVVLAVVASPALAVG